MKRVVVGFLLGILFSSFLVGYAVVGHSFFQKVELIAWYLFPSPGRLPW